MISFVLNDSLNALQHRPSQFLAEIGCYLPHPRRLNPVDQVWLRCWTVDRDLLFHHCPNILNDVQVWTVSWPWLQQQNAFVLQPWFDSFYIVTWCTIVLELTAIVEADKVWQLVFQDIQVHSPFYCGVLRHYPQPKRSCQIMIEERTHSAAGAMARKQSSPDSINKRNE